jgi:hypothetical protein
VSGPNGIGGVDILRKEEPVDSVSINLLSKVDSPH